MIVKSFVLCLVIIPLFIFGGIFPLETEYAIIQKIEDELQVNPAPETVKVDQITTKSFSVTGKTEADVEVYVLKNGERFKKVKSNSEGAFSFRIPLQHDQTIFEFYLLDNKGNKREATAIEVVNEDRPDKMLLSVPMIKQLPELPRGCEVTSLAMMLNYAGIKADKMTLAEEVMKNPVNYKEENGKIHFGNPHNGFVGDMYSFKKPGFGVFHGPIEDLANLYLPNRIVNLTGKPFERVLDYVSGGHPVWVVTTSTFKYVPLDEWETWYTELGPLQVTSRMHSILVTGYDSQYIYFNDPLDGKANKKVLKKDFIEGWTQYGSQAVTYY